MTYASIPAAATNSAPATSSFLSSDTTRSSSSAASAPSSSAKVSIDGSCGSDMGETCLGSTFGDCCSSHGYCGSSDDYCGTGCQPEFGTCGPATYGGSMKRGAGLHEHGSEAFDDSSRPLHHSRRLNRERN